MLSDKLGGAEFCNVEVERGFFFKTRTISLVGVGVCVAMYHSRAACENRELLHSAQQMSARYGHAYSFGDAWERIRSAYTPPGGPLGGELEPERRGGFDERERERINPRRHPLIAERLDHRRLKNTDLWSIKNTLRYMFYNHRKGIYVSVRKGRLNVFMAFQNRGFRNPLAPALELEPGTDAKIEHMMRRHPECLDFVSPVQVPAVPESTFTPPTRHKSTWTTTGCLVMGVKDMPSKRKASLRHGNGNGNGNGHMEPDKAFLPMLHFMRHLCDSAPPDDPVPDCDFFLNTYDQLLLRKDGRAPNRHVLDHPPGVSILGDAESDIAGVSAFREARMCPIASFCTSPDYLDLPFVFPDDVLRVFGGFEGPKCDNPYLDIPQYETAWSAKTPTAVFRGAATGSGWTAGDNQRIRLARVAVDCNRSASDSIMLLDVKLTGKEEVRFKKNGSSRYVRFVLPEDTGATQDPSSSLSSRQQSRYKYVIYVEGNVAAYRLCNLFAMGSVVIYVESEYIPWVWPLLRHGENCLKVSHVEDVPELIRWCRRNDDMCEQIARAGMRTYVDHMCEPGMREYVLAMCHMLSDDQGR